VHDLQSPLSAALLNLAFTRQQTAGAGRAVHDTINDIEQSLRQLQRIIGDLLDFDRLASGLLAVNVTVADVGLLAREVAGEAETMARSLGCAVQVTGWAHASCDIALIRRVLWNLVANGLKFGAGRGPVTITLEQLGPGQGCRVAVTDHGEGVPAATRERLFTLYGRDEGNQRPGHGIGLAFCRLVVEAHHGRIWLEDPPGGGATFVFSLPDR
jgi:two-component system sensor histidine kinase KdpD